MGQKGSALCPDFRYRAMNSEAQIFDRRYDHHGHRLFSASGSRPFEQRKDVMSIICRPCRESVINAVRSFSGHHNPALRIHAYNRNLRPLGRTFSRVDKIFRLSWFGHQCLLVVPVLALVVAPCMTGHPLIITHVRLLSPCLNNWFMTEFPAG